MLVDRLKDARSQLMFFKQAAKLQQGRCVRGAFPSEIHTDKAGNRLAVVQRVFNRLIGEPKALLCNVHAQHPLKTDRWAAAAFPFGIERFKLSHKERPRYYRFDLSEKAIASRRVASGAFSHHTQDQRSLLAQELSTRPLQSLLYIYFSSPGRGRAH